MNLFFIFTYLLSTLIVLLLYLLLIKRLEINWQKKNKHAVSYFLPLLLTLLLVFQIMLDFRARSLDLLELLQNNSAVVIVSSEQIDTERQLIILDGNEELIYRNISFPQDSSRFYRLNYGRRSKIVLSLEEVVEKNGE
ncbi:MAG: hypothetical protein Q4P08_01125 [Eubacteriales bacterium]|nr:hypothetical protein [Eubacteriales bacterium]